MSSPLEPAAASTENHAQAQRITTDKSQTTYVNFCRGTLTPEEVILDLGFNANAFGMKVLDEELAISNRLVMSPAAAKRLLFLLNDIVRRHEQNFGEVEVDFRRRLKNPPATAGAKS
jgi:hypothetical protein